MRSHKAPRGSFITHLRTIIPMSIIKQGLSVKGTTGEQALILAKSGITTPRDDEWFQYTDARTSSLIGDIYYALSYIKKRPTDLLLDKSVQEYLETNPLREDISIPTLEKGLVWIDMSTWGMVVNSDVTDRNKAYEKIKGILLIENDESMKSWGRKRPYNSDVLREKYKETEPDYWCYVHATNCYYYAFPLSKTVSFGELIKVEQRDYDVSKHGYAKAVALGLTALKMISEGQFVRESSSYEDQRLPFGKKKIKSKGKGKKGVKFKQKYREFRTTRFRHIDSEPQVKTRSYTPPEHYTPRNVRSHYKERWVTLDYVEKHNVIDDDIIDLEDRTKSYKRGEATKTWVKIKLWYEFTQNPELSPVQEIERYRV